MVTALRWALGGLLAAGLIALLFSFAGRWHPAADTLAVFRPGVALACLPFVALLGRRHWLFWPGLALVLAVLAIRAWDDRPGRGPAPGFTVYQKNMYFGMQDHAPLARHIRAAAPDFVTLQEVTRGNAAMLDVLSDILPSQHVCPFAAVGAVAVASRFPAVSGATVCAEGDGLVAMQVETPEGPVWIVSIHLHLALAPWPGRPGRAAGPAARHARWPDADRRGFQHGALVGRAAPDHAGQRHRAARSGAADPARGLPDAAAPADRHRPCAGRARWRDRCGAAPAARLGPSRGAGPAAGRNIPARAALTVAVTLP
jgi:hypothetical protein